MSFVALLGRLDKFGVAPTMNWRGQSKTNSLCGTFATVAILGLVIAFGVLFSSDMINKTNPAQTQSMLYGGLNEETRLITDDTFTMAFGLADSTTLAYYRDSNYIFSSC